MWTVAKCPIATQPKRWNVGRVDRVDHLFGWVGIITGEAAAAGRSGFLLAKNPALVGVRVKIAPFGRASTASVASETAPFTAVCRSTFSEDSSLKTAVPACLSDGHTTRSDQIAVGPRVVRVLSRGRHAALPGETSATKEMECR